MTEKYTRFNTTINDIDFRMIRKDGKCWIKAVPITQLSTPSSLHIILNGREHHWDIYDESGRDKHIIYFKGYKSLPSFYLKSEQNCYKIDCNYDGIKIFPITEAHKMDIYIKDKCSCISSKASCWAVAIYTTSRGEKSPFNEM